MPDESRFGDWARRLLRLPAARWLGAAVALGAGTAAATAIMLAVDAAVSDGPSRDLTALRLPAIAMLIIGQVWLIVVNLAKERPAAGRWSVFTRFRAWFGGDLPAPVVVAVVAVALAGSVLAVAAGLAIDGGPATGMDGQDEAGWQQLFAGMATFFYAMHAGSALGGLAWARQQKDGREGVARETAGG